jgi:putative ABC transport system permease protein
MDKEMGIDFSSSLVVRAPRTADDAETRMNKLLLFRNRALEIPQVKDFTFTSDIPGQEINNFFSGRRKGFDQNDNKAYFAINVDDQFLDFYKIKLLAGRNFHKNETFSQRTVLLNKLAMERMGYTDPEEAVNKIMVKGADQEWLIIGIVDDFYFKSIKTAPVPTVISLNDGPKTYLTMKLSSLQPGAMASLVSKLRTQYGAIFPDQPFEYFSLDAKMVLDLKPDKTFGAVFTLFSTLAILIAVVGIIGLILITINQNRKEMGIRKALGAEVMDVSRLLSGQMLVQFMVAICSAVPLSWYGYDHWFLQSYLHHIELNFWFFLIPVMIMSIVIFSVIFLLSLNVFRMNLSEVLQYE